MYNVAIIGAGLISSGFDDIDDERILTHAHAIVAHDKFNLCGFYDIKKENSEAAAKKWNTIALSKIDDIKNAQIITIATPDAFHLESFRHAVSLKPKLIILEKPIARTIEEAKEIIALSKDTPVAINFSRRYVKEFQDLAIKIKKGAWGEFITGRGIYGKGFIHNGSHMLDLLNLFLGKITNIKTYDKISDFYENDPTRTIQITFKNNRNFLAQALDCNIATVFELELFFERKRIQILNSGEKIVFYEVENCHNVYKFFKYENEINTELNFAMYNLYENAYNFLDKNQKLFAPINEVFEEKLYV